MRILIASNFEPERNSGAAGSLLEIGEAHRRLGHDVELFWMRHSHFRILAESFLIPYRQARQIGSFLRNTGPVDVVVVSQPFAFHTFESLSRKYPHTLFINRTHGWEPRYSASQDEFGWDSAATVGGRLMRWVARRLRSYMCRRTVLSAHGVIAACRQDAQWIQSAYNLPAERVACVPYGICPNHFSQAPRRSPEALPRRLIFSGQYQERKGTRILENVLPQLAAEFSDATLTFVVPQSEVDLVKSKYVGSWASRLVVLPWMSQTDLYKKFGEQDVLLFPSYFEGFGKVVIEAMAMGCVPVGFEEGVLSDLTKDGVLTCAHGDHAAFGRLLRDVLIGNLDLARLSRNATCLARRRSWDDTAREEIRFFESLLASAR